MSPESNLSIKMGYLGRYTVCAALFVVALVVYSWCFESAMMAAEAGHSRGHSVPASIPLLLFGSVIALTSSATVTAKSYNRLGATLFIIGIGLMLLANTVGIPV
jgi:hypothetical protein